MATDQDLGDSLYSAVGKSIVLTILMSFLTSFMLCEIMNGLGCDFHQEGSNVLMD